MIKLNLFKKKPVEFKSSKNTAIYKSIVNESTGRRKRDISTITGFNEKKNGWAYFGRLKDQIDKEALYIPLIYDDLLVIKNKFKKKKSINVMVLGAGEGVEVEILNNLNEKQKWVDIDTLSLTNSLSENARDIVRKDHSPKEVNFESFFEHFNHLKFIGKYDYIYSDLGVGYHTHYPEIALLKVGSMLRIGGFATIQIQSEKNINSSKIIKHINEYLLKKGLLNKLKLDVIYSNSEKVFSSKLKPLNKSIVVTYIRLERLK